MNRLPYFRYLLFAIFYLLFAFLSPVNAQTAANDPDLNLTLRGWNPTDGVLQLLANICGPTDPQATPPQLSTLINGILNANPEFTSLFKVKQRDTDPNPGQDIPADYTNNWGATLVGIGANPGDNVTVPQSGYDFSQVVHADENNLTLVYNNERGADRIRVGYTIHLSGFRVNPELLNPGNDGIPVPEGATLGTITGNDVLVSIRDSGSFMDPRIIKDWWQALPESLGIDLGICAAGLDSGLAPGTQPYVHEQTLAKVAVSDVSCANAPETSTSLSGDPLVCQILGSCDTDDLVEVIKYDASNKKVPWYNQLEENILSRPGSAAQMWSANFSHPEIEKEYDAPYYKSTRPPDQCKAKKEYLEHVHVQCQNYPTPEAPNPDICILPYWFNQKYAKDFSLEPEQLQDILARGYYNELIFYYNRLSGINCDGEYPYGLDKTDKLVYDNILPQIRDDVEFEICYWVSYIEKPEGEHFTINTPGPLLRIMEFLCPVKNVGGQKWQSSIEELKLGKSNPLYQNSYIDSMMTKSTKNLLRRDVVEKREDKYKAIQADTFACTTNADIHGPVIDLEDEDYCKDPANALPCTVAKRINCEARFCTESEGGEKSDITFTPALLGQLRSLISNTILQLLSPIFSNPMEFISRVKPFASGEKEAKSYNYILASEEVRWMLANNQEIFFPTFRRRNDWETNQPSFNEITSAPTDSIDPKQPFEAILGEIAPGIFDKITFTVGLNTEDPPVDGSIKSQPQDFQTESQDIFRLRKNKGNLTNSGCREQEDRKSDCYWKTEWQGEYIPPFTPSERPGIDLPNQINCVNRPDSDIPDQFQHLLGSFKARIINHANNWLGEENSTNHAELCYNDVIYRAVNHSPPINPLWALTVWLNESNASNYAASAKLWQDFGINNPEVPAENFDAQITRFLDLSSNLIRTYKDNHEECFTSGYTDMQSAMYIYHLGYQDCPGGVNTEYYDAIFGDNGVWQWVSGGCTDIPANFTDMVCLPK